MSPEGTILRESATKCHLRRHEVPEGVAILRSYSDVCTSVGLKPASWIASTICALCSSP